MRQALRLIMIENITQLGLLKKSYPSHENANKSFLSFLSYQCHRDAQGKDKKRSRGRPIVFPWLRGIDRLICLWSRNSIINVQNAFFSLSITPIEWHHIEARRKEPKKHLYSVALLFMKVRCFKENWGEADCCLSLINISNLIWGVGMRRSSTSSRCYCNKYLFF